MSNIWDRVIFHIVQQPAQDFLILVNMDEIRQDLHGNQTDVNILSRVGVALEQGGIAGQVAVLLQGSDGLQAADGDGELVTWQQLLQV